MDVEQLFGKEFQLKKKKKLYYFLLFGKATHVTYDLLAFISVQVIGGGQRMQCSWMGCSSSANAMGRRRRRRRRRSITD